jgi:hydroxyacyl-ACP dehydratase HTD2-like protein with hotdog domain
MKNLALITLVLAFFCSALSFAGYVGFQLLAGKVPTPVHVQDRIAATNDLEQLRTVSLDAIRDNHSLLESTWKLTLSILLFTAVEFTIIAMLLVLVFREIRKAEVADAGRTQTSSGS